MTDINTAIILAGGYGRRMMPITEHLPKALTPFWGVPIIQHQLKQLERLRFKEVIILSGYLSYQIEKFLLKHDYKLKVKILESDPELSPKDRILKFQKIIPDKFLLLYCDNFVSDDQVIRNIISSRDRYHFLLDKRDFGNIEIINKSYLKFHESRFKGKELFVELGYIGIKDKDFLRILRDSDQLSTALKQICNSSQVGFSILGDSYLSASNIKTYLKQTSYEKIIFLDRDGIINVCPDKGSYVSSFNEFTPILENWNFLKYLSRNGFSFIIITNQAGIALKRIDPTFLTTLHHSIAIRMILEEINILGIYYCPHHWDDNCLCRKPMPGLITKAMNDLSLTSNSYLMLGDSSSDIEAAKNAGIHGFLLNSTEFDQLSDVKKTIEHIYKVSLN